MSYEGYEQFVCPDGHTWNVDAMTHSYDSDKERKENVTCPHCGQIAEWQCSVDETNGFCADDPNTFAGPMKEIGFTDIPQADHYGNKYFTKLLKYEIDNSTKRWLKVDRDFFQQII